MIDKNRCKEVLQNLAEDYDDCDDMIDALRSLEAEEEITSEEYDYIIANWDDLLK